MFKMWSRMLKWFKARWWLGGLAVLTVGAWRAVRGLWANEPKAPPAAGPVQMSSEEAQAERVRIKTEMDKRRADSGQKVSGWLERIRKARGKSGPSAALILCLSLAWTGVQGCAAVQVGVDTPISLREAESACEAMVGRCERGEAPACESAEMCARLYGLASGAIINLDECQQNCRVTTGEQAYHLSACRALAERLRADRWVWGAVGLAIGSAVAAGVALSL